MLTVPPPGAMCHAHAEAMGVVSCRGCGVFLCRECARLLPDTTPGHLCATCWQSASASQALPSTRSDRARGLGTWSVYLQAGVVLLAIGSSVRLVYRKDLAAIVAMLLCVALALGLVFVKRSTRR